MALTLDELRALPPVMDIVPAGEILGLGRDGAYEAAKSGVLPTILVGVRRRKVPTAELLRSIGIDYDGLQRTPAPDPSRRWSAGS